MTTVGKMVCQNPPVVCRPGVSVTDTHSSHAVAWVLKILSFNDVFLSK